MSKTWRVQVLEDALRKIMRLCQTAATHGAIYDAAEKALKRTKP